MSELLHLKPYFYYSGGGDCSLKKKSLFEVARE